MVGSLIFSLKRAIYIFKTDGLVPLLKRSFRSTFGGTYYLFQKDVEEALRNVKEGQVTPKVQNFKPFTFQFVCSNQQADEMSTKGFEFRSSDGKDRERLDAGAIARCLFDGKKLVHIGWDALSEKAKEKIDPLPYKVDFKNNEACAGWIWTDPKYRGLNLMPYCSFRRLQFLKDRGIKVIRYSMLVSNISAHRATAKTTSERYAKARHFKLLWWKFYKEMPLEEDR